MLNSGLLPHQFGRQGSSLQMKVWNMELWLLFTGAATLSTLGGGGRMEEALLGAYSIVISGESSSESSTCSLLSLRSTERLAW